MPVLTALRPIGIRDFVFASNRLSEIAAGAAVVAWATAGDASGAAFRAGLGEGEVVAQAGGDLLLRFTGTEDARAFAARYSRLLHDDAPGLACVIVHRPYASGGLAEALRAVRPALAAAAGRVRPSLRPLGLGVTALCQEGGAPATEVIPIHSGRGAKMMPVSAMIARRRRVGADEIDERWRSFMPDSEATMAASGEGTFTLPLAMTELARTEGAGEEVGVIQIELERLDRLPDRRLGEAGGAEDIDGAEDADDAAVATYRAVVGTATDAGEVILRAVLARAAAAGGGASPLPARPLLWNGASITVLCDGRLAEALASAALAASGAMRRRGGRGPGRVRVGVAVQSVAAPLNAAYDLAVERCGASGAPRQRGGPSRPSGGRGRTADELEGRGVAAVPDETGEAVAEMLDDTPINARMTEESGVTAESGEATETTDAADATGAVGDGAAPAGPPPDGEDQDGTDGHEAGAAPEADA